MPAGPEVMLSILRGRGVVVVLGVGVKFPSGEALRKAKDIFPYVRGIWIGVVGPRGGCWTRWVG